ncbi:MAG: sigma-70 family RNA polymerase sigma factor [Gemmatimonadaceae bacterium]|nr:sigma-70 family RNA polymerase sigma factor [Gemmatimonadaceae bacterium]
MSARVVPTGSPMMNADHLASRDIEALLDAHLDRVRRAARRYRVTEQDLDLVIQETRVRIWRLTERGTPAEDIGPSLIYRMAAGAAIDVLRRRDARREVPETAAITVPSREGNALDRVALREALRGCFAALLERRRAVVGLHLRGTPREEIAVLLRWSEAKTRNLLYRGLDDLRLCLRNAGFEEGG